MNLEAYLQRIGYTGPVAPTVEVLHAMAFHQPTSIAFENLNPFLGLPVDISPAALEEKMVAKERGGYCYEQNTLLHQALSAIGFQVSGLAARVLWNRPIDTITGRSHMILRVDLDGRSFIVDSGFGVATLTGALELVEDTEQKTPHEVFRLVRLDGEWYSQLNSRGEWKTLYRFDSQRQYLDDYAHANYYTSTHPNSHFVSNLMAARPAAEGRYTLSNRDFGFHPLGGETERRRLNSVGEIRETLERVFGLDLSGLEGLDDRLAGLFVDDGVATGDGG